MPHFQNEREDAMAMSDQNKKLDRIIVLLEELIGHSRKAMDHAARETEQRDAAKRAEDEQKKADAEARKRGEDRQKSEQSRENERRQQEAQRRAPEQPTAMPRPETPRDENSLFGETAPLPPAQMNVQGRNAVMASESDREKESQRDNVFHRDVGDKKD